MKIVASMVLVLLIAGCGVESVGTAASVAKLQAEQAKQGKEKMEALKANLDTAMKEAEQNRKKAEEEAEK